MVTDTSLNAYLATTAGRMTQAKTLLNALRAAPRTDPELVRLTGIRLSSVNGARNELMRLGLVEDSGRRVVNRDTGMPNILWRVVRGASG